MRTMDQSFADSSALSKAELCGQLNIVNQSQGYLEMIILSVIFSYYVLGIQKKQLECGIAPQTIASCECLPETESISLIASILVIVALRYFFCLSVQTAQDACKSGVRIKQANRNALAGFLVLAAAILRFWNLIESA